MLRGLYTAAAGMMTEQIRTDTIANNLANVNTTGYKKDEAVSEEFESVLLRRINDDETGQGNISDLQNIDTARNYLLKGTVAADNGSGAPVIGSLGRGAKIAEIAVIRDQGALENTGNKLDLALTGDGYFAVNTPQGVRYTRDGNFYRSAAGQLVTANNQAVLGTNGSAINLPPDTADINIGSDGTVNAGGQDVGQIQVVNFADRRALIKEGNNLYYPQNGARPQAANASIQQGFLERSNVNVAKEMVELINNYRTYEADSKALTTQDSLLDKAVNDVGRVS
ncbi:flagellar basal-body rod protein FlgF [Pectinatus frisingensis]|jgi:flagellar basal-body rod protein FlgG|uniref:flagellar basal-body rod protein FlgF n=1 Tax=Pectinatus frisingensis TaxID=865 RepID=UPI0015F41606|nr:flagellar basal-body rod protein FlgF [Pectinatus frisingensis]